MIKAIYKALGVYWLFRAAKKGPRGLAAYAVRRELRKMANRRINEVR